MSSRDSRSGWLRLLPALANIRLERGTGIDHYLVGGYWHWVFWPNLLMSTD